MMPPVPDQLERKAGVVERGRRELALAAETVSVQDERQRRPPTRLLLRLYRDRCRAASGVNAHLTAGVERARTS
jgi:hypothetical protein